VKINGAYYRDVLLTQQLLPVVQEISWDFFILQQDSAPAHRARDTIKLLKRETPGFIAPNLWPSDSPVDYKIWGEMQQRVYQTMTWMIVHDLDELKQPAWFGTNIIYDAILMSVRVFVPKNDILSICFDSPGARMW